MRVVDSIPMPNTSDMALSVDSQYMVWYWDKTRRWMCKERAARSILADGVDMISRVHVFPPEIQSIFYAAAGAIIPANFRRREMEPLAAPLTPRTPLPPRWHPSDASASRRVARSQRIEQPDQFEPDIGDEEGEEEELYEVFAEDMEEGEGSQLPTMAVTSGIIPFMIASPGSQQYEQQMMMNTYGYLTPQHQIQPPTQEQFASDYSAISHGYCTPESQMVAPRPYGFSAYSSSSFHSEFSGFARFASPAGHHHFRGSSSSDQGQEQQHASHIFQPSQDDQQLEHPPSVPRRLRRQNRNQRRGCGTGGHL